MTSRLTPPDPTGDDALRIEDGTTVPRANTQIDEEIAELRHPRYQFHEKIAHGGMGLVVRAVDRSLNRELAIKVLQRRHHGDRDLVRRFYDEAQINGQLQHPGVVPVHEVGELPGGWPFIAMKLVKGETLAAKLKGRSSPADDLPTFLGIYSQICQTMAYSHSRHVIHRDLKPLNVMVGAFGEVQVMDWGLAKVLSSDRGAQPDSTDDRLADDDVPITEVQVGAGGGATQVGSILGTYPYMPPEQARGILSKMDERSDVFSLGAILCEILTGRPAYEGATYHDLRVQAIVADLGPAFQRLDASGCESELVELAKKCLSAESSQRPRDAGEVAGAIDRYLRGVQDRLQQAEIARAAAQIKAAEERKRRRILAGLVVAVGLAMAAGLLAYRLVEGQRAERRERYTRLATASLGQAHELSKQLEVAPKDNPARRQKAAELCADLLDRVRETVEQLSDRSVTDSVRILLQREAEIYEKKAQARLRDLRMLDRLEEVYALKAESGDADFDRVNSGTMFVFGRRGLVEYPVVFRDYGIDVEKLSAVATANAIAATDIAPFLTRALDDWFFLDPQAQGARKLLEVANLADTDSFRKQVRSARAANDRATLENLSVSANLDAQPLSSLLMLAEGIVELENCNAAARVLRRVFHQYQDDFWYNNQLGLYLLHTVPPDPDEALRCFRAAQSLRPNSHTNQLDIGDALVACGQFEEAIAAYQRVWDLKPQFQLVYLKIADAYMNMDRLEQAEATCRRGLRIAPQSAWLLNRLGDALAAKGQLQEALTAYRESVKYRPSVAFLRRSLATALADAQQYDEAMVEATMARQVEPNHPEGIYAVAGVYYRWDKPEEAIRICREGQTRFPNSPWIASILGFVLSKANRHEEAIDVTRQAVARQPRNHWMHNNLGLALAAKGDIDEALIAFREAVRLNPHRSDHRLNLAQTLRKKGKLAEALAEVEIAQKAHPNNATAILEHADILMDLNQFEAAMQLGIEAVRRQPASAFCQNSVGNLLFRRGLYNASVPYYEAAIKLEPRVATYHRNLAGSLRYSGKLDRALQAIREAIRLNPKDADYYSIMGHIHSRSGRTNEAIAAYRSAVQRDETNGDYWDSLGTALRSAKDFSDSIDALKTAARLKPDDASIHQHLSISFWRASRYEEGIAAAREAIRLQPAMDIAHNALGLCAEKQGDTKLALAAYREAVRLRPSDPVLYSNLGRLMASINVDAETVMVLRRAAELKPQESDYWYWLGNALVRAGQQADAMAAYRKAQSLTADNVVAQSRLVLAIDDAGRHDEALMLARAMVEKSPKLASAHLALAQLLGRRGQPADAESSYRRALTCNPLDAGVHYALGDFLLKSNRFAEAETAYRNCHLLDSTRLDAPLAIGITLLRQGRPADAAEQFHRVIAKFPASLAGYTRLSEALIELDRPAEALTAARKGVDLAPQEPRVHYRLANALRANGRFIEALSAYELALKLRTPESDQGVDPPQWEAAIAAARRCIELDAVHRATKAGNAKPASAALMLELASFCREFNREPLAAATYYRDAFALNPAMVASHGVFAAKAAVATATGRADAASLKPEERVAWRRQSLDWLRRSRTGATRAWLADREFAPVSSPWALAVLPVAERREWIDLWNEVAKKQGP
jgi:serine/threonine-protein kinase